MSTNKRDTCHNLDGVIFTPLSVKPSKQLLFIY